MLLVFGKFISKEILWQINLKMVFGILIFINYKELNSQVSHFHTNNAKNI